MRLKHATHAMFYGLHSRPSRVFQIGIAVLIALNAVAVILETVESLRLLYQPIFATLEWSAVAIFSAEYLARLWVADLTPRFQSPVVGRLRYALTPMALIDLLAILPSLLMLAGLDLRVLRLVRLARLLKLTRYSRALHTLAKAVQSSKNELFLTGGLMIGLLLISSTLIYFAEHEVQPNVFSSIPAALWWGVVTLTTIGYGDVYPVTVVGKSIASISAAFGIGLFALPGGILAAALIEGARNPGQTGTDIAACPHCGNSLRQCGEQKIQEALKE